jgi:ubiquinone/menaquinone biosynthesis C-methylase UbiE
MNRLTFAQLEVRPGDTVLEVGFGGGGLLAMILDATEGEVTGVDLSEVMVARARRRFANVPRLRLHVGSVDALPLANASVDKACSVNNIYFWPDPAAAMAELARVLRPAAGWRRLRAGRAANGRPSFPASACSRKPRCGA